MILSLQEQAWLKTLKKSKINDNSDIKYNIYIILA